MTPETAIKEAIKGYLVYNGWFSFPNTQGLGSKKGIADRYAIKNGNGVWIEVKAPGKKQSPSQIEFQKDIEEKKGHYLLAFSVEDVENYFVENFGERRSLMF